MLNLEILGFDGAALITTLFCSLEALGAVVLGAVSPAAGEPTLPALISEWFSRLNWIDYVLLLGLFSGLFVGIGVGFYRQVAIFSALALGLVAAARLSQPLTETPVFGPVKEVLGDAGADVAAFAFVLWSALVVGILCCLIFHSFFSRTVRIFDGALGGAMGVAISSLVFGLVLLGVVHSQSTQFDAPIRESQIGSRLAEGARVVSRIFPPDIQERIDEALDKVNGRDPAPPRRQG